MQLLDELQSGFYCNNCRRDYRSKNELLPTHWKYSTKMKNQYQRESV